MRISHLIKELEKAKEKLGDIPVAFDCGDGLCATYSVWMPYIGSEEVYICDTPRGELGYDNSQDTPEPFEEYGNAD